MLANNVNCLSQCKTPGDCCDIIMNSEVLNIHKVENSRVDIKHDNQHGRYCQQLPTATVGQWPVYSTSDEHKKLKISWKSLTIFSLVN